MVGTLHCVRISITNAGPQLHDYSSKTRIHWDMTIRECLDSHDILLQ
jgi:hypothetical protein